MIQSEPKENYKIIKKYKNREKKMRMIKQIEHHRYCHYDPYDYVKHGEEAQT